MSYMCEGLMVMINFVTDWDGFFNTNLGAAWCTPIRKISNTHSCTLFNMLRCHLIML